MKRVAVLIAALVLAPLPVLAAADEPKIDLTMKIIGEDGKPLKNGDERPTGIEVLSDFDVAGKHYTTGATVTDPEEVRRVAAYLTSKNLAKLGDYAGLYRQCRNALSWLGQTGASLRHEIGRKLGVKTWWRVLAIAYVCVFWGTVAEAKYIGSSPKTSKPSSTETYLVKFSNEVLINKETINPEEFITFDNIRNFIIGKCTRLNSVKLGHILFEKPSRRVFRDFNISINWFFRKIFCYSNDNGSLQKKGWSSTEVLEDHFNFRVLEPRREISYATFAQGGICYKNYREISTNSSFSMERRGFSSFLCCFDGSQKISGLLVSGDAQSSGFSKQTSCSPSQYCRKNDNQNIRDSDIKEAVKKTLFLSIELLVLYGGLNLSTRDGVRRSAGYILIASCLLSVFFWPLI